ncbi:MAG: PKD domain-containing protein [Methylococcales bacterium]|nr:PKD domain-containing protein [Methylococcales bacterium]
MKLMARHYFNALLCPLLLSLAWPNAVMALVDLSPKISVSYQAPVYRAATADFVVAGVLHNKTDQAIPAPISLVVDGFNQADGSLALLQADGVVPTGDAYKVILTQGQLAANADLPFSVNFGFANPISGLAGDALEKLAQKAFQFTLPVAANFSVDFLVAQIPANNRQPVADAGTDQQGLVGNAINLDGRASTDADGHTVEYVWSLLERPSGSTAKLSTPTEPVSVLVADTPGVYEARLVVSDGFVLSKPDTVKVTVYANGGGNHSPKVTSTALSNGLATREYNYNVIAADADGDPLSYRLIEFPAGMTISAKGSIYWLVVDKPHELIPVAVEVSDGRGGVDVQKFSIHIMPCVCN